jgi:glutaconyl-CoA/methylmalonyl-CoA decarboxylase subunit gamma
MMYAVRIGDQTYSVEINDLDSRPVVVSVDGEKMDVWPDEQAPTPEMEPLKQPAGTEQTAPMPENRSSSNSVPSQAASLRGIPAPIPGVIVEISAAVGQSVNRGDELCVLEAMKMKNSIKAGRNGTIGKINVSVGDQVRHGQVLMEYTD